MARKKPLKRKLRAEEFAADGLPYSEVEVSISIRILGGKINRSRLAVNVLTDPALEGLARQSLDEMEIENYGKSADGFFGACLSKNWNGWEDLNDDYPRIETSGRKGFEKECCEAMNEYIRKSVEWALEMHCRGMAEAGIDEDGNPVN